MGDLFAFFGTKRRCLAQRPQHGLHRYFDVSLPDALTDTGPDQTRIQDEGDAPQVGAASTQAAMMVINSDSETEAPSLEQPKPQPQAHQPSHVYGGREDLLRCCIQSQFYLVSARLVTLGPNAHPAEVLAARCLKMGRATWDELMSLMEKLPSDRKLRWASSALGSHPAKSFMTGSWARGPHFGLTKNLRTFPVASMLLAQIVSCVDSQHKFSSITLALNVESSVHRDSYNAQGSRNLILPCSKCQGGGVWIQQANCSTALTAGWSYYIWDTSTPVRFSPADAHATAPWGGDRLVLIAYHVRHTGELSVEDAEALTTAGFNPNFTLS